MKRIEFLNLYVPTESIEQRTAWHRMAILRVGCLLSAWFIVYAIAESIFRIRGF